MVLNFMYLLVIGEIQIVQFEKDVTFVFAHSCNEIFEDLVKHPFAISSLPCSEFLTEE